MAFNLLFLSFFSDLVYRDADAFNPGDYIDAPQQVNLPVGSTTTEFQVSIVDDSEIESSESFEILLVRVADTAGFTRLDAVELGDQTTTVTIKNDDSGNYLICIKLQLWANGGQS